MSVSKNISLKEKYFSNLSGDITGGLMGAIVALPLCLAFGVTSGLGPAAGLYGAIACGILAGLFGGTPGQCSGPTGPMTVVAATMASTNPNRPELIFASVIVAGLLQIALGFAKAGGLIGYVPYPVISGFMTGIGSIIVIVELAPLFGVSGSGNVLVALQKIFEIIPNLNQQALIISVLTIMIIYGLPKISRRLPASLIALISMTVLSNMLKFELPTIGEIPSSLPIPSLPNISVADLHIVFENGLTLACLGAIDSLLTSLVMDKVTGQKHDSDQELIGQGIGNMAAGLIGGLPGAGATMRSMVNVKSGGTTQLSGALHGIFLLAVLICLARIASTIPMAALAAILFTVGLSIMDWRVLKSLRKAPKSDSLVMATVLVLTIFVDLIVAVLIGVALASVLFVKQLSDAKVSAMAELETLQELNELTEDVPETVRKNTFCYELNGPLFFGEAKNLTDAIDKVSSNPRYIILRFSNVPLIDQTGAFALEHAIEKWQAAGAKILFVGMKKTISQILVDSGAKIDMANSFDRFEQALEAIRLMETKMDYQ
ncbi:MAG: SulP family inorganic anion transporter [Candidatus Obscuribacterales bacterium]|nr:SulP family inorganic anion transporter [Candidatus Obscuribacterales bacterium]